MEGVGSEWGSTGPTRFVLLWRLMVRRRISEIIIRPEDRQSCTKDKWPNEEGKQVVIVEHVHRDARAHSDHENTVR